MWLVALFLLLPCSASGLGLFGLFGSQNDDILDQNVADSLDNIINSLPDNIAGNLKNDLINCQTATTVETCVQEAFANNDISECSECQIMANQFLNDLKAVTDTTDSTLTSVPTSTAVTEQDQSADTSDSPLIDNLDGMYSVGSGNETEDSNTTSKSSNVMVNVTTTTTKRNKWNNPNPAAKTTTKVTSIVSTATTDHDTDQTQTTAKQSSSTLLAMEPVVTTGREDEKDRTDGLSVVVPTEDAKKPDEKKEDDVARTTKKSVVTTVKPIEIPLNENSSDGLYSPNKKNQTTTTSTVTTSTETILPDVPEQPSSNSSLTNGTGSSDLSDNAPISTTETGVDDTVTLKDEMVASNDDTATSEAGMVTLEYETETSEDNTVTSKDDAITSEDDRATLQDNVFTSQDDTVTLKDDTVTSKEGAVTSVDQTTTEAADYQATSVISGKSSNISRTTTTSFSSNSARSEGSTLRTDTTDTDAESITPDTMSDDISTGTSSASSTVGTSATVDSVSFNESLATSVITVQSTDENVSVPFSDNTSTVRNDVSATSTFVSSATDYTLDDNITTSENQSHTTQSVNMSTSTMTSVPTDATDQTQTEEGKGEKTASVTGSAESTDGTNYGSDGTRTASGEPNDDYGATGTTRIPGTTETENDSQSTKNDDSSYPAVTTIEPVATTRILADGTKILNASSSAFENCTILHTETRQHTNGTITEWSEWSGTPCPDGQTDTQNNVTEKPATGTNIGGNDWSSGNATTLQPTTRVLADGTRIINESMSAFDNCTVLVTQTRLHPNQTTSEWSQWFDNGCTEGEIHIPGEITEVMDTTGITPAGQEPNPAEDTEAPTTRLMQDGTKILNESATAFANCTMLITQTRLHPNQTTSEWSEWFGTGCTEGKIVIPGEVTQPYQNDSTTTKYTNVDGTTTTLQSPTTRVMIDGTKIINESAQAFPNCTMLITQTRLHSNNTISEWSQWFDSGCTEGKIQIPGEFTEPMETTTESAACPTNLITSTNGSTLTINGSQRVHSCDDGWAFPDMSPVRIYECHDNAWVGYNNESCQPLPTCPTSIITASNGSTVTVNGSQLVHTCRTGWAFSDKSPVRIYECHDNFWVGYKNETCEPMVCPQLSIDLTDSGSPTAGDVTLKGSQSFGTMVVHTCRSGFLFETGEPMRIYECMTGGEWTSNVGGKCKAATRSEL